jgi:cytochrome c-type biogenesis protein CcmH/NrfG
MSDNQVAPLFTELAKRPNDAELLRKIGRYYLSAHQFKAAQPYYERAAAAKRNPDTLNELSFIYYSLGDLDHAMATLDRALEVQPSNPNVLLNLAMFQWQGKTDASAAIATWKKFLRTNPNDRRRPEVEHMIAQAQKHLAIAPGTKTVKPAM